MARDANQRFYGAGPFGAGPNTIWGVRRVSSPECPAGTSIVGDFSKVVVGWRETATVLATDQGPGLFDTNMIQLRAELRAAVAVGAPRAFAVANLTAA